MSNKIIDHKGNKFKSEKEMCKYWDVKYSVYRNRKHYGWTLEECLKGRTVVYDHLGNKFNREINMCKYWGVIYSI
jgi:hypothetical protein